ncbi:MAG: DNA polymerase beta superfamily protein [bacterium]
MVEIKNKNALHLLKEMIKEKGKENIDYLTFIKENILFEGDNLIFLTISGSQLYGMATEESDLDIKGVYLPSKHSLFLNCIREGYDGLSTSMEKNTKNTSNDVDISLWSLHKFFSLLKIGDSNAYELLFAQHNGKCTLYADENYKKIYNNRKKLIGTIPLNNGFLKFAYNQSKKYQYRGYNYQTLKFVLDFFDSLKEKGEYKPNAKLKNYTKRLLRKYKHSHPELTNNEIRKRLNVSITPKDTFLNINELKQYAVGMKTKVFLKSIKGWADTYGNRIQNSEGVDFRSVAHAFKVVKSVDIMLHNEGDLILPFKDNLAQYLLEIKKGKYSYKDLTLKLNNLIKELEQELSNTTIIQKYPNEKLLDALILDFYQTKKDK